MTNFENMMKNDIELIKEAVAATVGLKKEKPVLCSRLACGECNCGRPNCETKMREWLDAEYKKLIELNEQERLFCEMIKDGFLARDNCGTLYWYEKKPRKMGNTVWNDPTNGKFVNFKANKIVTLLFDEKLNFDFVKWEDEEPWPVKDILEVAEDED